MADATTVVGRSTRVQGRVTGEGDLEVQGFVRGEISVGGETTVDTGGMVDGNVTARRLIVRGAIKGDLLGRDAVVLEDGARVVGDIRAPRIAIAQGALVRGLVEADPGEGSRASSTREHAAARIPPNREAPQAPRGAGSPASRGEPGHGQAAVSRGVSSNQPSASLRGAVGSSSRAAPGAHAPPSALAGGHPAEGSQASSATPASEATNHATARRAPPPVLPSLKRARGQLVKKKER